jgi:hypothetical protein
MLRRRKRPPPIPGSTGELEAALKEIRADEAKAVREPPQGGIEGWLSKALFLVVGLIAMAAAGAVGKKAGDWVVPPPKSIDAQLADTVRRANQKLPMMVDKITRMDSMTMPEPRVLQYNYTLVKVDGTALDGFHSEVLPTVAARACSSPEVARIHDMGVTTVYVYRTADGTFASRLTVTKADCGSLGGKKP